MEIRQLEYFLKASEHKNLSAAARELFISEQALSKSIVSLEKELDFSLFVRDRKGVALTPAGKIMQKKAFEAVAGVARFKNAAADIRSEHDAKPIRIGFYEGFLGNGAAQFPIESLISFQRSHPRIALHIAEDANERVRDMVCSKELDMGVFVGEVPAACCSITLQQIRLDLVASKTNRLAKSGGVSWDDLKDQRIILSHRETRLQDMIESICRQHGFDPVIAPVSASFATSLAFVYEDEAVTLIDSGKQALVDWEKATIVEFAHENEAVKTPASIAWTNDKSISSNHYKLTDLLRKHFNRSRAFV